MTKFHEDRRKIVDFLLIVTFLASCKFLGSPSMYLSIFISSKYCEYVFQVKEYCPLVFRNLRERFGIDDASYMKSLTRPPKPMDSPGRSGAKFYASYDQLYVIKTLTSEEIEQMHSLLKQYHPFVVERHGKFPRNYLIQGVSFLIGFFK